MSSSSCAKWVLCSNDGDDQAEAQSAESARDRYKVNLVMDEWFAVPGIAEQLEGMYVIGWSEGIARRTPPAMNHFFNAYESGEMDRAWSIMKDKILPALK